MRNPPNILFLMTDQQRWDGVGCANPLVRTPNLDALARRGIFFRQAVCNAPMCIPSRYSLMLGLYPSQTGVRHNTQMYPTDDDLPLSPLPERLKSLGYQTACFGKTHWYPGVRVAGDLPMMGSKRGFEVVAQARTADPSEVEPGAIVMEQDDPAHWARIEEEMAAFGLGGENIAGYLGRTSDVPLEGHPEGWLTCQALHFLDHDRDSGRPLFLYVSFDAPHAGLNVPKPYETFYDLSLIPDQPTPPWKTSPRGHVQEDWRRAQWAQIPSLERRRSLLRYYAMCSLVDDLFGRVLLKLDSMGELDNTFVLFCSDHGDMLGDGYRFSKYCLYEGSVRVPLILAGAGIPSEKQGTIDDRPAELVDILPTLLEIAATSPVPSLAGRSLLQPPCRSGTFTELHGTGYEDVQHAPAYAWRSDGWKLILYINGAVQDATGRADQTLGELYDLRKDPQEWHNLYGRWRHRAKQEQLARQLLMHLATVWARYPHQVSRARL